MFTRILVFFAALTVFAAVPALSADAEPTAVQASEVSPDVTGAVEAVSQEAEEPLLDEWAAERQQVQDIRAEAARGIAAIEAQLDSADLTDAERLALHKEIGDIKVDSEIRIQEIRLAVAEARGMTRQAEEIRQALECLRNLDAPVEAVTVDRSAELAPGVPVAEPQGTLND
jgi:hypothetical protein